MPYSSFEHFSIAVCEVAGVPVPDLLPDRDGCIAFHLVLRDVIVNVAHAEAPENDEALILVTFGRLPRGREFQSLADMADANFAMLTPNAPVFGRNPATGEIVLRQAISLSKVEAVDVWAAIVRFAEIARLWRIDPTLASLATGDSPAAIHQFT